VIEAGGIAFTSTVSVVSAPDVHEFVSITETLPAIPVKPQFIEIELVPWPEAIVPPVTVHTYVFGELLVTE
jgi:hypothetical protein